MPTRTLKTQQDCLDFLTGLKLMGTGGGGAPKSGLEMLEAALAEGLDLTWIDAADLPEDAYSCTVYGSGSISEGRPDTLEAIQQIRASNREQHYISRAIDQARNVRNHSTANAFVWRHGRQFDYY